MTAQRQNDFSKAIHEAMARRIRMVMAAAGIDHNRELATLVESSESTVGRWTKSSPGETTHLKIAKALAGKGDLTSDVREIRDFLDLRRDAFPWKSEEGGLWAPLDETQTGRLATIRQIRQPGLIQIGQWPKAA